ncbi:LOW QUALITY PROTEIN: SWIB domain-containing protein/DEK_C domain-containing protein, partial [Cephalotus follicularis]
HPTNNNRYQILSPSKIAKWYRNRSWLGVLLNWDLNVTTTTIVRRRLEEEFGVDLSDKKAFIREHVDLFLQIQLDNKADEFGNDDHMVKEETDDDDDDVEEGEEEEEEKAASKRRPKKPNNEVQKREGGFNKLCSLSPQLQEFTGAPELARTEVVKQLWNYIREKILQDPSNRRNLMCDEALRTLFGVDSINMFQLTKHVWPLNSDDVVAVKSAEKEKRKLERLEDPDEPKRMGKRQKGGKSGFLAPLQLSDALVNFIGTGESEFSRADTVKRMWDYIKQNNLQDPSDKRMVICDKKLKELFDVDSLCGFAVSKLLTAHFVKS